ncbi:hypothetical protein HNQ93_001176 [Hymenobacter luteus]|uniref:DUF4349 domain-containing protein n=2 Tax=Hymenobacter TaxID=89966 RepID=A0A7W9SYQ3_9BACT|nr:MULTISPECIES: DUF4349 domain-containing protein [Hymenobacter]MBB4601463.1 hypothetical protein [Hymenobacter latericoloratus]MBB6058330.1 hypothetical protein [Hymenobacter luteus]
MKKYVRLLPLLGLMLTGCAQSAEQEVFPSQEVASTASVSAASTTATAESTADVPLARLWRVAGHPVIYQGTMELEVADFAAASARLDTALARRGAYLTSALETTDSDRHQQVLTIRVSSAQFLALTADLTRLGTVRSKELTSRDVAAELTRLRAAAHSATTDPLTAQTSAQEAQALAEQAALATLRLTYFQLRPALETSPTATLAPQLQAGLWFGWRVVGVVLILACYGWPLLLGLAGWALLRWRCRHPTQLVS